MVGEIAVNLYKWKMKGSLTVCVMITQETECPYNPGEWMGPFYFRPETKEQAQAVLELLDLFELNYHVAACAA